MLVQQEAPPVSAGADGCLPRRSRPNRFSKRGAGDSEEQKRIDGSVFAIQVLVPDIAEGVIRDALSRHNGDPDAALEAILGGPSGADAAAAPAAVASPAAPAEERVKEEAEAQAAVRASSAADVAPTVQQADLDADAMLALQLMEEDLQAAATAAPAAADGQAEEADAEAETSPGNRPAAARREAPRDETPEAPPPPKQEPPVDTGPPPWLPMLRPSGGYNSTLEAAPAGRQSRYQVQTDRLKAALGPAPSADIQPSMEGKGKGKSAGKGGG